MTMRKFTLAVKKSPGSKMHRGGRGAGGGGGGGGGRKKKKGGRRGKIKLVGECGVEG